MSDKKEKAPPHDALASLYNKPAAVAPAQRPIAPQLPVQTTFLSIYQGTPTNALARVGKNSAIEVNFNDRATITQDRLTLFIENYSQLTAGLKNSTIKLLQAGVLQLTGQNTYRGTDIDRLTHQVSFTLTEFMSLRGLKDRKEARKQIREDCETLLSLTFNWEEKRGGQVEAFSMIKPLYGASLDKGGDISLYFAPEFAFYLVNAYEMKLPALYWSINDRRNPNSSQLLWNIALFKKLNFGKKSEDIISVKTLLQCAPSIPPYKSLQKGREKVREKIIDPFERDMNALNESLEWTYCAARGAPLPEGTLENLTYSVFIKLYIKVQWKEYPELVR